jgi:myo-inositol catabolism protein IolS
MKYTNLHGTELNVSRIAMGCWALAGDMTWGPQEEEASVVAVNAALDAGINFFDTAEMYGNGLSEQRLGKALAKRRSEAVIASKFNPDHNDPVELTAACERTLNYLQTDYIDLYQIHWPSRTVPLEDTWTTLLKLKDQGKVREIGVCNFGTGDLGDVLKLGRPVTNQLPYSLLMRAIEFAILPTCAQKEMSILCYSPLLLGLLTGKYTSADEVPDGRARLRHFSTDRPQARHGEAGCEAETFTAIGKVVEVSQRLGQSPANVALAWLLHQDGVASVLNGIRTEEQASQNVAAAELTLDAEILAELNQATEPVKQALGPNPDMWQGAAESRFR